jgi:GDPmannose 4,6-dehydratase
VSFFACRHFGASRELDAMSRLAPITGMTGQDGPYLPELLLARAYEVHGSKRRPFNTAQLDHLYVDPHIGGPTLLLHYGDVTEPSNVIRITQQVQPHEIYNLAAQSQFQVSFDTPEYTGKADASGVLRLLEGTRISKLENRSGFIEHRQASGLAMLLRRRLNRHGRRQRSPYQNRVPE